MRTILFRQYDLLLSAAWMEKERNFDLYIFSPKAKKYLKKRLEKLYRVIFLRIHPVNLYRVSAVMRTPWKGSQIPKCQSGDIDVRYAHLYAATRPSNSSYTSKVNRMALMEDEITLERPSLLEVAPRQKILEALMSKDTTVSMDEDALEHEMVLNLGPQHPATHGVLRVLLRLDGETIVSAESELGYLHRGYEKLAENMTYHEYIPHTDRLDYISPVANNIAYCMAVEKLLKLEFHRVDNTFA